MLIDGRRLALVVGVFVKIAALEGVRFVQSSQSAPSWLLSDWARRTRWWRWILGTTSPFHLSPTVSFTVGTCCVML